VLAQEIVTETEGHDQGEEEDPQGPLEAPQEGVNPDAAILKIKY